MEHKGTHMDGSEWVIPIKNGELTHLAVQGNKDFYILETEEGHMYSIDVTRIDGRNFVEVNCERHGVWTDLNLADFILQRYHILAI